MELKLLVLVLFVAVLVEVRAIEVEEAVGQLVARDCLNLQTGGHLTHKLLLRHHLGQAARSQCLQTVQRRAIVGLFYFFIKVVLELFFAVDHGFINQVQFFDMFLTYSIRGGVL